MARPEFEVFFNLDQILCHDEGDGIGNAEPYLWTVFFRISGEDVTIIFDGIDFSVNPPKPIIHLEGAPLMQFTFGSHGNLGTTDVDAGDVVPIPAALGRFNTRLRPIPIPQELKDLGKQFGVDVPDDVPGFVGVAVVLMEEDNVTDDGAEAGHDALNEAVQVAVQSIIDTRSFDNSGVTQDDINALTKGIGDKVSDAIANQQNFFENIWSWLNADDQIGNVSFIQNTDTLTGQTSIPLQQRWRNEGDWEITGEVTPTQTCPADAIAGLLNALFSNTRRVPYDRAGLQHFRDHEFARYPGARLWFDVANRNKASLAGLMLKDSKARQLVLDLFTNAQELVKKPGAHIPEEHFDRAVELLKLLAKDRNRSTAIDASRALFLVEQCRGKTIRQTLEIMNKTAPVRNQKRSKTNLLQ